MIRSKSFYRTFFLLTLSLALQNLLSFGVNMLDTLMLGRYSQDAMSGVSLCNQIQFLLQMLVLGTAEGAVVLGSQYWGKGRLEPIGHIIGVALRFGLAFAAPLFLAVLFFPGQVLALLSNDGAVMEQGRQYFQIICFSYIIFVLANILGTSLRSVEIVRIGYMISFSTLCINGVLNYLLIFGRCGFPEMGVRGAAVATLVSRCVELLIVVLFLKYREPYLRLTWKKLVHIDTSYIRDYARTAMPVVANQTMWGLATMVQTGILGHLGGDVTAANAIAVQVSQILSVAVFGASSAAGVLTGKSIGMGQTSREQLRPLVTTLQVIFLLLGLVSGGAIALLRAPILSFFGDSLTPRAYQLSMQFMLVLAVTTVGTGYHMTCENGIIRGGGDTRFSFWMNLISMWLIVVPLSLMAAFWWKLPPAAVFFLLKWDQIYKSVPVALRLYSWKWVRPVTRSDERL